MKCINHQDREAEYICRECSQPICKECRLNIRGENICKSCVELSYQEPFQEQSKEGKLAILFHFLCSLIPGAGQMQQGAMKRGVQIMLTFTAIVVITGIFRMEELVFFGGVVWFYSFFDSYHVKKARLANIKGWDKEFIKPEYLDKFLQNRDNKWIAWLIVLVGVITLMNAFIFLGYSFNFRLLNVGIMVLEKSILPLVAIFIGWKMLQKSNDVEKKENISLEIDNQETNKEELSS